MFTLKVIVFILTTIFLNRALLGAAINTVFIEPFYEDHKLAQQIRTDIPSMSWKKFSDINGLSFDMPADWKARELTPDQRPRNHNYNLFIDAGRYGTVFSVISPIIYNSDYWGSTSISSYDIVDKFKKV